jgi:hypothetical protein
LFGVVVEVTGTGSEMEDDIDFGIAGVAVHNLEEGEKLGNLFGTGKALENFGSWAVDG